MTFTLRIYLMGLIALVPSPDRKSLSVVLLNATGYPEHHRHAPVLVYPCGALKDRCDNIREVDNVAADLNLLPFINIVDDDPDHPETRRFTLDPANNRKTFGAVRLEGENIAVSPTVAGDLIFSDDGKLCHHWYHKWLGVLPADRLQGRDGAWMPRMAAISPRSARIKREHLASPDKNKVSAVLRVQESFGLVRTLGLADRCSRVRTMTFKVTTLPVPLPRVRQATADVTAIELPIAADKVTVTLTKFGGGDRKIELQPRGNERVVEILIGNLTPLDSNASNDICLQRGQPVDHFRLYYELTDPTLPFEKRPRAHFGWRSIANGEVEPLLAETPDVILVVSDRTGGDGSGGVSRAACMNVELQNP